MKFNIHGKKNLALVTDIYTWYPYKMKDSKNLDETVLGQISYVNLKFTLQMSLWLMIFIFRINTAINWKFLIAVEISTACNCKGNCWLNFTFEVSPTVLYTAPHQTCNTTSVLKSTRVLSFAFPSLILLFHIFSLTSYQFLT